MLFKSNVAHQIQQPVPKQRTGFPIRKFKIRISELVVGSGESDQNDFVPSLRNGFSDE